MPNHITNVVHIKSKDSDIVEKVEKQLQSKKLFFDFNNIVPMPDTVERGDLNTLNWKPHGRYTDNRYDRSIKNWGTKRNSYSSYKEEYQDEERDEQYENVTMYTKIIVFDTARNTPGLIWDSLAEKYKNRNVEFYIEYADEDTPNNCGKIKISEGELLLTEMSGNMEFAEKVQKMSKRHRIESVITEVES